MNGVDYGMTDRFADLHHEVYWSTYETQGIFKALQSSGQDEKYDELIAVWKKVQDGKDVTYGKCVGRNYVNLSTIFSPFNEARYISASIYYLTVLLLTFSFPNQCIRLICGYRLHDSFCRCNC